MVEGRYRWRQRMDTKLLIGKGADLESKDKENSRTLLSWAAANGHEAVVMRRVLNWSLRTNMGRCRCCWPQREGVRQS
jgi:hypothetical protein